VWNELEAAEQFVSQALTRGAQLADQYLLVYGSLVLARVLHAGRETAQAQQRLTALAARTQQSKASLLHRQVRTCQAWLQLAVGDLARVQRWYTTCTQQNDEIPLTQHEQEALILARLLIVQRKTTKALHLLEQWRAEAHALGRISSELEILVLMALAHVTHKDLPQAKQMILEALALARAEGYRRLFLDEGETMAALLRDVLPDVRNELLGSYVRTLLLAFARERSGQVDASPADPALLSEPLSVQEQRVLRLLAAGHSNPEIAQELVVSVNTVKTQVQSIYRKLKVNNRVEASEVARDLHLL
jgi:LuxR family maltose regulon positive regulatory protein